MKKLLSILFLICAISTLNITSFAETNTVRTASSITTPVQVQTPITIKPLDLVNNPSEYLNKKITMTSRFSKYSTLGLDYKPAYKNSDNYITFLFLRDDAANNIPLSELKMFIDRKSAEKLPDIKEGDKVKVVGTVFSNALGDAWVNVDTLEEIK